MKLHHYTNKLHYKKYHTSEENNSNHIDVNKILNKN